MDPKLSGLDPKLREAYERVMSGPSANPVPQGVSQPNPVTPPPVTPSATTPAPKPESVPAPAPVNPPPPAPAASSFAFNANYQTNQSATTTVKKAGGKTSSVLIILGLVVLLAAYTFVWVYLFKLKIPFLPF